MKLGKPTIESGAGVVVALLGMASVPATGGVTAYSEAGLALLAAYNKLAKDTSSHGDEIAIVVKRVQQGLATEFDQLAAGGDVTGDAFAPAEAAVAAALPLLNPSPQKLFACGRDNERFVALLLAGAEEHTCHDFKPGNDPQVAHNRAMLAAIFRGALRALDGDADFERKISGRFQREIFLRFNGFERAQERQTADTAEILRLLRGSVATGEAEKAGVPDKTIIALAQRISPKVDNIKDALIELCAAIAIVISNRQEAARGSNFGDDIDEVMQRLSALTDDGKLDEASNAADEAIDQWLTKQNEERAKGIKLFDAGINQDILRRDAVAAAGKIFEKSQPLLPTQLLPLVELLWWQYSQFYQRGESGSNFLTPK